MKKTYLKPELAKQVIKVETIMAAGSWDDPNGTGSDQIKGSSATQGGSALGGSHFSIWSDDEEE